MCFDLIFAAYGVILKWHLDIKKRILLKDCDYKDMQLAKSNIAFTVVFTKKNFTDPDTTESGLQNLDLQPLNRPNFTIWFKTCEHLDVYVNLCIIAAPKG